MSISIGTNVSTNPDINIGKLFQMIGMAGSDCSSAKGKNTNDVGSNDENVNNFFQVLDQQIAALLQNSETEISEQLTTKKDLCTILEKLLQDDQNAEGEILSEFALLAVAGKLNELYEEDSDGQGKSSIASIIQEENQSVISKQDVEQSTDLFAKLADIQSHLADVKEKIIATLNTKTDGNKNELPDKPVNLTVEQSTELFDKVANIKSHLAVIEEKVVAAMNSSTEKIETPINANNTALQEGTVNLSVEQSEKLHSEIVKIKTLLSGVEEKVVAAPNANAEKSAATINGINTSMQDKPVILSAEENTNLIAKVTTIEKLLTGMKEKVFAQLNTDGKNIEEQTPSTKTFQQEMLVGTLNENENIQRKASTKEEEKVSQLRDAVLKEQDQTVRDVKNKISDRQEMLLADKKENSSINDSQKNMTAKIAAVPDESAVMIEKTKSANKGKISNIEKNIESNSLTTPNMSGIGKVKTEAGEITSSSIINRVSTAFRENLSGEGGRIKITLAPPSLGTLEMDVVVRNGAVKVMLMADNKDVQQLLSGNLESLKGSLQSQGLTIERCDVMMQDRREQYPQGFNQQAFNQEHSDGRHYDEGEGYNQDAQMVTPLKIRPIKQTTQNSGNISLFA